MNRRQSRLPIVAVLGAVVVLLFTIACGADATSTPVPTKAPAAPVATTAPAPTVAPPPAVAKPEGTLTVAFTAIEPGAAGVPYHMTSPGQNVAYIAFDSMLQGERWCRGHRFHSGELGDGSRGGAADLLHQKRDAVARQWRMGGCHFR